MKFTPIPPEEIPENANRTSPAYKLIREFVESNEEAAEITDTQLGPGSLAYQLRAIVNRNMYPVKVIQRGSRVFLRRTGGPKT